MFATAIVLSFIYHNVLTMKEVQATSHLLMIRPVNFGFNAETAVNNAFQVAGYTGNAQQQALFEFDAFVHKLRNHGIDVMVVDDTPDPHTPDSIFPNNWISFHADGTVVLYPMFAENRRKERKAHVTASIEKKFNITQTIDLSGFEASEQFLEGTGSMVLDRENRLAYACLSPRTNENAMRDFCERLGYTAVLFDAADGNGQPIYHTNVLMCVADKYVVICLDAIPDDAEKSMVQQAIEDSGKLVVPVSLHQMNHFAGNMLQLQNNAGQLYLVMSTQAFNTLTETQIELLNGFNPIIHSSLETIERNGGGSARCMMAEVHLPVKG